MNLEKYIDQKMKLQIETGDKLLTFHVTINSANSEQVEFTDRNGTVFVFSNDKIIGGSVE